jgi:hypothetical protein
MDNFAKEKLTKKIKRIYNKGIFNNKKIVLFGVSPAAKEIKNALAKLGYEPESVIDNDPRKIGTKCMGMTVCTPEDRLAPFDKDAVILIISHAYFKEMSYQLSTMGYKERKNFFVLNYKIDDRLRSFYYMLFRLCRGFFAYKKLMKTGCEKIFIAPYTGTGDIYLAGLYFEDYLKKNHIENYVFVVVSGACKRVTKIFDIKNVVIIQPRIADELIIINTFFHKNLGIITLNDGWNHSKQWLRGYNGLNFEKVFRYFVFGFDDNYSLRHPTLPDRQAEVDEIFTKYGLVKHKTVVLAPYSNTLFDLPQSFLEEIARIAAGKGYEVCTNCAGEEKPVKGTKAVFFPLDIAKQFLDNCGVFIGVRSGLCDIISNSSCKKIIFYEKDSFFYKSSPFEYFSLTSMGLCDDAHEIEYDFDKEGEMIKLVSEKICD